MGELPFVDSSLARMDICGNGLSVIASRIYNTVIVKLEWAITSQLKPVACNIGRVRIDLARFIAHQNDPKNVVS